MITVYTPKHQRHDPPHEFLEGRLFPFTEAPTRAAVIVQALEAAALGPFVAPNDWGLAPILAVHSEEYVTHLRTIYEHWCAVGGTPEAVLPSALPVRELHRHSPHPYAAAGYYAFDLSAPITAATYDVALESAYCALSAAQLLLNGERASYALCRPPGHHAHRDMMGGFCYLNNAAIAANYLATEPQTLTPSRVALLDIDVHAGNGTQAIFYERSDVLFVSIHGAPDWEYPYFAGFADERGAGAGEGFTINYPLEPGVDDAQYLRVLHQALDAIARFDPAYLVLSAGFDTFDGDPLGKFKLSTQGFLAIGRAIKGLALPTVVVQEGGYAMAELGTNVVSLLRGLNASDALLD